MSAGPKRQPDARLEPEAADAAREPQPPPEREDDAPDAGSRLSESEAHGRGVSKPPFGEEESG